MLLKCRSLALLAIVSVYLQFVVATSTESTKDPNKTIITVVAIVGSVLFLFVVFGLVVLSWYCYCNMYQRDMQQAQTVEEKRDVIWQYFWNEPATAMFLEHQMYNDMERQNAGIQQAAQNAEIQQAMLQKANKK